MMKAHLKVKVIIRCALKEESREGEEDILLLTRFVCLLNIWKQDQGMHTAQWVCMRGLADKMAIPR